MLQREPTKIQLRPEDKDEYLEHVRELKEAKRSRAAQSGPVPFSPDSEEEPPKPTAAERLGLARR